MLVCHRDSNYLETLLFAPHFKCLYSFLVLAVIHDSSRKMCVCVCVPSQQFTCCCCFLSNLVSPWSASIKFVPLGKKKIITHKRLKISTWELAGIFKGIFFPWYLPPMNRKHILILQKNKIALYKVYLALHQNTF